MDKYTTINFDGFTADIPALESEGGKKYPLLVHYDCQSNPQNAYLEICPENGTELYATFNGEIGNAVTMWYFHGRELHVDIPNTARAQDIRNFVEQNAKLIARVIAGYSTDWDGNNTVGVLDDDAAEALEKLQHEAEESYWWTEPDVMDLDSNGKLIEDWSFSLELLDIDREDGEMEIEETGPYKTGSIVTTWKQAESGEWTLNSRRGWIEEARLDWERLTKKKPEEVQEVLREIIETGSASYGDCMEDGI